VAVTHFAVMVLIVTFLGNSKRVLEQNSNRGRANNTALHRTPKASAFFTNWQVIGQRTLSSKSNSFFAFAACELSRYSPRLVTNMIADIHGKISRSGSSLSERLEDKLTGDIFGTIRYLPAEKLLLPFLRKAYWLDPDTHERQSLELGFNTEPDIIFWPHNYPDIEPDIMIKGTESDQKIKILIEVKYKSGLSGDDNPSESVTANESNNQLIKQALALADDFEFNRKLLIFLTEDGAYPKELLDRVSRIIESESKLHNVKLYWLSWHDIKSVVTNLIYCPLSIFEKRIVDDILQYCNRKGFRRYEYHHAKRISRWKFITQISKQKKFPSHTFALKFLLHPAKSYKKWSFAHE